MCELLCVRQFCEVYQVILALFLSHVQVVPERKLFYTNINICFVYNRSDGNFLLLHFANGKVSVTRRINILNFFSPRETVISVHVCMLHAACSSNVKLLDAQNVYIPLRVELGLHDTILLSIIRTVRATTHKQY